MLNDLAVVGRKLTEAYFVKEAKTRAQVVVANVGAVGVCDSLLLVILVKDCLLCPL